MGILLEPHFREITSPANLRINDQINKYRNQCRENSCTAAYHHFAFGQSPYSPPPSVIEALAANADKHDYLPTAGLPALRETIARYYATHFGVECTADQVVVSPGSKELIAILLAVLRGTVVVPTPSWVSYLPQARILKKDVVSVRTQPEDGFKLTPELLDHTLTHLQTPQKVLILNHPNNPTGVVFNRAELEDLATVCRKHGVIVISDEIYALTSFDPDGFTSMMNVYPEGTIVTGGLSKDRSCGGYRVGVGIFPKEPAQLIQDATKVAGSTYSCVAAPIQFAALEAYSGSPEVDEYVRDCARVNELAGMTASSLLNDIPGVTSTVPGGAFYLYVDFNESSDAFKNVGLNTCAEFCEDLLEVEHTALLPGAALLLPEDDFSVRCSYVDFDGDAALAAWRKAPPTTESEKQSFVKEQFPLITIGVANIARYIGQVRAGTRPKHG